MIVGLAIALAAVLAILAILQFKSHNKRREADRLGLRLIEQMDKHRSALISYYYQSRREDFFGNVDDTKWLKRIDTFLTTQVLAHGTDYRIWRNTGIGWKSIRIVDGWTRKEVEKRSSAAIRLEQAVGVTALQYEQLCAQALRLDDWVVQTTPITGDRGADLIAVKGSFRLIVQCKRYAKPVGNKAVQEVYSAVRLYDGNLACVIAPSGFTRQAEEEALALGVRLLHHSALESLNI